MGSTYTASAYAHLEPESMTYTFIEDPAKNAAQHSDKSIPITTFRSITGKPTSNKTPTKKNRHPKPNILSDPSKMNIAHPNHQQPMVVAVLPPIPPLPNTANYPASSTLNRPPHHFCISVTDPSQYYYGWPSDTNAWNGPTHPELCMCDGRRNGARSMRLWWF